MPFTVSHLTDSNSMLHSACFVCLLITIIITNYKSDLQIERDHIKQRVIATQHDAKSVADAKDISENDLTRGILYYNYLGLKFQKAESDCLR